MFFVSLLLNQIVGWMRSQSGTASLRAIVYMDEIAGYFPPVANPPSKAPLLTLLKQARAFGVGIVLATQNPVDLDYKGLANTGTWFLGRLQTERDKARAIFAWIGHNIRYDYKKYQNPPDPPRFTMVAAHEARLRATMTRRGGSPVRPRLLPYSH